jgi:hypothetical protein
MELYPSSQSRLPRFFTGDFNFKGLTARRFYKSFGVKGLIEVHFLNRQVFIIRSVWVRMGATSILVATNWPRG